MSVPDGACHHRCPPTTWCLPLEREAARRMTKKPSDDRAQLRAIQVVVIVAAVLAACAALSLGAVWAVHALF